VKALLSERQNIPMNQVQPMLEEKMVNPSEPVVFIHKWDWLARRAAKKLAKKGYINTCFLMGGTESLEQYLESVEKS
jgi:hypothetical protein